MASVLLDYFKRPEIREKVAAICSKHRVAQQSRSTTVHLDEMSVFDR